MPTSLRISSGANRLKVMDPFDWTKDKAIYQRWQLWSEKARLTLEAMEGDSEKTKISYFHHWINGEGMGHIGPWKNNKTLISQLEHNRLEEHQKDGKYSSDKIESYFSLFETLLASKSNPLLAVGELHFAKQGSMTSKEFHSHIVKIAKWCQFPNPETEERAFRDAVFLGMNSQCARGKAINLMNEEGKELTVDIFMNQLQVEDCKAQQERIPAQFHNICASGRNQAQNNAGAHRSSNHSHQSRKPPGMEGKPEHQLGQKCSAKNPSARNATK